MNKLKVMVIDDEYMAREGMKRTIDWGEYDCVICGEAQDAIEGIKKARELQPDIIITDIKMPGMDGLEMAKKIGEFLPYVKFIVITGYDDFEYAKRAVKINAMDFLLKPIDTNEFIQSIKKAAKECSRVKERTAITSERILLDMMRGKVQRDQVLDNIKKYNINIDKFIILLVQNDSFENEKSLENSHILYQKNEIIQECILEILGYENSIVECHEDKMAVILRDCFKTFQEIEVTLKKLQGEVIKRCDTTITIGVSEEGCLPYIKTTYDQSKIALQNRLYEGKGSITFFKNIEKKGKTDIEFTNKIKKEIIITIKACDRRKLEDILLELYLHIFKNNKTNIYLIKQMSIEIIGAAVDILGEYNIDKDEILGYDFNPYGSVQNKNVIDDIYIYVEEVLGKILDSIKEKVVNTSESGIKKAIDYINEHYTKEISLNHVAGVVYLNESYLSRKLKQTLGLSFVEYITKLRMERAIELLQNHDIKVQDAAEEIGYNDYRYFSTIFKKYTGYLPKDFVKQK